MHSMDAFGKNRRKVVAGNIAHPNCQSVNDLLPYPVQQVIRNLT